MILAGLKNDREGLYGIKNFGMRITADQAKIEE
jgi:hypothetical protein